MLWKSGQIIKEDLHRKQNNNTTTVIQKQFNYHTHNNLRRDKGRLIPSSPNNPGLVTQLRRQTQRTQTIGDANPLTPRQPRLSHPTVEAYHKGARTKPLSYKDKGNKGWVNNEGKTDPKGGGNPKLSGGGRGRPPRTTPSHLSQPPRPDTRRNVNVSG